MTAEKITHWLHHALRAPCACGFTCQWCLRGRHEWCASGVCRA
jgi:hypothetical protein